MCNILISIAELSPWYKQDIIPLNFTNRINEVWNEAKTRHIEYLSIKEIQALLTITKSGLNHKYTSPYAIFTAYVIAT